MVRAPQRYYARLAMKPHVHATLPRLGLAASLCVYLVLTPHDARSAETAPSVPEGERPRIALALSGGGARGAAHIGVLKVLEELRVPIDCVAGTSMGAIVGGAFAAGMPPRELEKILLRTDWDAVFTDRPPRAEISSRRKLDDYKTLFAAEFGLKDGSLRLPKGLVAGVSIESFLRSLTQSAVGISDFQKLPIPFRAIAADIETGEEVVLASGSVPQAMRASMAIPGFVSPVEIDGRLLVDGGIANNLPIDVARKQCNAGAVIAVNISTPAMKRDDIGSALTVVTQLLNFLGKATVDRQLAGLGPQDILIAPELGDISSGSFERSADAIAIGEKAARELTERLSRYSIPETQYAELRRTQVAGTTRLEPVDEIRIEGLQRTNPAVLRALVETKPGEPVTEEQIVADLRRIYGRGDFETVDYRISQELGKRVLTITPREKSWGPDYIRFGLSFATDFSGEDSFNALVSYRRTWLNRLGAEWVLEGQVGRDAYLLSELYHPLHERGIWFVAPYAMVGQSKRGLFVGADRFADYLARDARIGLDAGMVLGTWGEARLGLLARKIDARVETGSPLLPDVKTNASGYRFRLFADNYDDPYFPRSGHAATLSAFSSARALGADESYRRTEIYAGGARSWGAHTFWLTVNGGTDYHSGLPGYEAFTLGGPLRLSGYQIQEISGRRMVFARAMYYNRTIKLPDLLGSGVYVGASLEGATVGGPFFSGASTGQFWSASAFLAASSALGPAFFGLGYGGNGRGGIYLMLGLP